MDPANKQQESHESQVEEGVVDQVEDITDVNEELSIEDALSEEFDRLESELSEEVDGEEQTQTEAEAEAQAAEEGWDEPAPERWPGELKEVYNNLPIQARKAMLEGVYKPMQRQYGESTQQLAQMRKQVEPMLAAMNNYRNDFERMGVNPTQAFQTQMAWAAHFSRVGPEQGLRDMRDAYGLSKPQPGQEGQSPDQYLTPVERSMKSEIEYLKQKMNGAEQTQQQAIAAQQHQRQMAQKYAVLEELKSFSNEQADGKPAHPHMEKVAPAIAGLIRGGVVKRVDDYGQVLPVSQVMKQAYELACRMDPSIRSVTPSRQVQRAKAAQDLGVVANSPAGRVDVEGLSLTEQLDHEYERLAKRAG